MFTFSIKAGLSLPSKDLHGMKEEQVEKAGQQSFLAMDTTDGAGCEAREKARAVWASEVGKKQEKEEGIIHTLYGATNSRANNN